MTEPTDASTEAVSGASESSAADTLRQLLDEPRPKDEVWQDQAARAVARLAIEFPQEPDSVRALRAASLITAAQMKGVKGAKKRALKLTRWADERPPAIQSLAAADEQLACVAMLSKLNVPWAREYVSEAFGAWGAAAPVISELLHWARSLYPDLRAFAPVYAGWLRASAQPDRLLAMLKEAPRLLKSPRSHPHALAECLAQVAEGALAGLGLAADEKQKAAILLALLALAQEVAVTCPAVILEAPTVHMVVRLRAGPTSPSAAKALDQHLDVLTAATLSLLLVEVERFGAAAITHWWPVMPLFRQAYPRWDQAISDAAKDSPALGQWLRSSLPVTEDVQDAPYENEAVFAQLLPAWQQLLADVPDAPQARSLTQWIETAAKQSNVEYLGRAGDIVDFDPVEHQLADDGQTPPRRVRLVRSGVLARRVDGSWRVLVRAVVVPS